MRAFSRTILPILGVAATAVAVPSRTQGNTLGRHQTSESSGTHVSRAFEKRRHRGAEPDWAAIDVLMLPMHKPKANDKPYWTAIHETLEQGDPLWDVFVAPGYPRKAFTAFCSQTPGPTNLVRCFTYEGFDPFAIWVAKPEEWRRCVEDAPTPQASCFNLDEKNTHTTPHRYPAMPEESLLTVWDVGGGLACAQPLDAQPNSKINCWVKELPARIYLYRVEQTEQSLADFQWCFSNRDQCMKLVPEVAAKEKEYAETLTEDEMAKLLEGGK